MNSRRFVKRPAERKRYTINYIDWLDTAETLISVQFAVAPEGLTVESPQVSLDGTSVIFFASQGTAGVTYTVTATVMTSGDQTKQDDIVFSVRAA